MEQSNKMILLSKQIHKIFVNIGPKLTVMRKLPVILDTGTGYNFLWEVQLTPLIKTRILCESKTTKTHDTSDKPLQIMRTMKRYVHVDRTTKLVSFRVSNWLAVPALPRCNFCDQFVECVYLKTCVVKLVGASTVLVVRHYEKHRSAVSRTTKIVRFQKRKGRVSS